MSRRWGESPRCDYTQGRQDSRGTLSPVACTCTLILSSPWPEAQGDPPAVPETWWPGDGAGAFSTRVASAETWKFTETAALWLVCRRAGGESGRADCGGGKGQPLLKRSPVCSPCPSYLGQVGLGSHATEEICFWSSCSPSGSPMRGCRFLSSRWYLAMREA